MVKAFSKKISRPATTETRQKERSRNWKALFLFLIAATLVSVLVFQVLTNPDQFPSVLNVVGMICGLAVVVLIGGQARSLRANSDAERSVGQETGSVDDPVALLTENLPDMVCVCSVDGTLLKVSENCHEATGYASKELLATGPAGWVYLQDRGGFLKALDDCIATGQPGGFVFRALPNHSIAASDRAHPEKWLEMRCSALPDGFGAGNDGDKLRLATFRDVTAYKRSNQQLVDERGYAECANQTKSRFIASMSHELRTPLNAIIGFSEILKSGHLNGPLKKKTEEYSKLIHASGLHLLSILNDVLDVSKIEAGKYEIIPEAFDVAAIIRECRDIMQGTAMQKSISIDLDIPKDPPFLVADRRAVKQVLINLLSNAVKFTEDGGEVCLRMERVGRKIRLVVSDVGIGMSAEHVARIGEPFLQEENNYNRQINGTGLGLFMVKGLVALHGGEIFISSKEGEGTDAIVILPLTVSSAGPVPGRENQKLVRLSEHLSGSPVEDPAFEKAIN